MQLQWQINFDAGPNTTPVTEDFENYAVGATALCPWINLNVNNAVHFNKDTNPWAIAQVGVDDSKGLRISYAAQNNDWLISPELNPSGQTVKFMAKIKDSQYPESIKLAYSMTDQKPASFTDIETRILKNTDWEEISFDVPAEAKYFAIVSVSADKYETYIDNITYIPRTIQAPHVTETFTGVALEDGKWHGFSFVNHNSPKDFTFADGEVKLDYADKDYVDNWIISPEILGAGQVVQFDYYGNKKPTVNIEVYCGPDASVESFLMSEPVMVIKEADIWDQEWGTHTFTTQGDTRYFAIRVYEYDGWGARIDNITYAPLDAAPAAAPQKAATVRDLKGYNVYCNGEKVNDEPVEGTSFLHNTLAGEGEYEYFVSAVYASGESGMSLSSASVTVAAEDLKLNAVEVVEGNVEGNTVTLSWAEPDDLSVDAYDFTDDFSGYTTSSLKYNDPDAEGKVFGTIGPWILVNNNGVRNQGASDDARPWIFSSQALKCGWDAEGIEDWIISPLLSTKAQTISFTAKSVDGSYKDNFRVLVSYTGNHPDDFTKLPEDRFEIVPNVQTTYEVELPDGARYFAIVDNAADGAGLIIDNFAFEAGIQRLKGSVLGYNIYRQTAAPAGAPARAEGEWVKVNDAPVTGTTFVDTPGEGTHNYKITAVYPFGESELSDGVEVNVVPTGINVVGVDFAGKAEYFNLQGVKVENPVKGQIYIVRRGNSVTKELVK